MSKSIAVTGIGNAIVDVIAQCDDAFLNDNGVEKGIMQLIDAPRARALYQVMPPATEKSGGSVANSIAGIASLGVKTGFIGKVKEDQLGDIFAHDIKAQGTVFDTPRMENSHEDETARSMILVTPDGERSMNTYLGVANLLDEDDCDPVLLRDTDIVYLEGYLFDRPAAQRAFVKAMETTKSAGGKAALSLSDPFCVERHRDAFADLVRNHVDLLFCNNHELMSLYQVDDLDQAMAKAQSEVELVACTTGPDGVSVSTKDEVISLPAEDVEVVDKTGAGDMFAAGFLAGLSLNKSLKECGHMGGIAAGEVISHIGARPEVSLVELFREKGVL